MPDLYTLVRPLLFRMDPERAHTLTLALMKRGLVPRTRPVYEKALEQTLWGRTFPNPVGMAAGFDKNAEAIRALFGLGFGFVEVGTVTPKAQAGNPKPRIFRDPVHEAVINRMGFPNDGMAKFKENLEAFLAETPRLPGILGVNIGMNKDQAAPLEDYVTLIRTLGPLADYLTVNISSPNTPGLRDLQTRDSVRALISTLKAERCQCCRENPPPLLLKLAPDLNPEQQEALAQTALEEEIDGLILTNTTLERPDTLPPAFAKEQGGLSGQPLADKSTAIIRNFYRLTDGKIPIIGVGGVSSGQDAYDKIKAGASLVQLYTAMIFKGHSVARAVNTELAALLKAGGFSHVREAIGVDAGVE